MAVTEQTEPLTLSDARFREVVLDADVPVLVDVWAPWCNPCHVIAPTLERLAADADGRYRVAKVNVDQNPETAANYQISALPTVLLFKRGEVVDRIVGVNPSGVYEQAIAKTLG